ncbi:MAG: acyl-CoA reductase, partial [Chitinophagales bacterium]
GEIISEKSNGLEALMLKSAAHNPWFTLFHQELALQTFTENFFDANKLNNWINHYPVAEKKQKNIGLIMAGNIPFVGMHDLLCVLMSGYVAQVKLSSKDAHFFPWMHSTLQTISDVFNDRILFTEQLKNFDAVIATGSNNAGRYFTYYFGKYPHIIRRNRTSVAVLTGDESDEELYALGKDVFYYYGLGCRNVGKIFLPEGYEPEKLFRIWEDYRYVIENNKYKNNYDYNRTLLLLNQTEHLANDFFMMVESEELFSPLATVHYAYYNTPEQLHTYFSKEAENLQCIVANIPGNTPLGQSQMPALDDYADKIDTMQFLTQL